MRLPALELGRQASLAAVAAADAPGVRACRMGGAGVAHEAGLCLERHHELAFLYTRDVTAPVRVFAGERRAAGSAQRPAGLHAAAPCAAPPLRLRGPPHAIRQRSLHCWPPRRVTANCVPAHDSAGEADGVIPVAVLQWWADHGHSVELIVLPAGTHDGIVWTNGADSLRLLAEDLGHAPQDRGRPRAAA